MADSHEHPPSPGTLSALLEDLYRENPPATQAWADGLRPGAIVGRYELQRELGRGGFGVVWQARDRELGRLVAFKVLRASGELRERRLLAEAEVAARLSHPSIVTVLDVGRGDQGVYLVHELLTGKTLAARLDEGSIAVREAVRIGVELARGLAHAHGNGVVHRDLTPANVQLLDDGQVKLLDLGMAAALGRRKVEGGTPAWMAPEQTTGAPEDERTDVWALGALLYRMLTGSVPGGPAGRGLSVAAAPALGRLVEAMLSEDPRARPRDASAVLEALQEVLDGLPRSSSGTERVRALPAPRLRWAAAGGVAGLVLGLVATAAVSLRATAGPPPGAVTMAAMGAYTTCRWDQLLREDFEATPAGARWRNGKLELGQRAVRRDGRGTWVQGGDWNQLFVPLPRLPEDFFFVEASFFAPEVSGHGASVYALTDPQGSMDWKASDVVGGRGIRLWGVPGGAPRFEWGLPDGVNTRSVLYSGGLQAPIQGKWHTLRVEGSRKGCWARASLDGVPLLSETGYCGFTGSHVMLGSNGEPYQNAEVAWRTLLVQEGTGDCR